MPDTAEVQDQDTAGSPPDVLETQTNKEFPAEHTLPFRGLLYLGSLTDEFTWMGHTFVIRTMKTLEKLAIGPIIQEYQGTNAENLAWATATVSMAIVSVDGQELPGPAFEESDEARYRRRFNVVKGGWYDPTILAVFDRYMTLEAEVQAVMQSLGESSGRAANSALGSSQSSPMQTEMDLSGTAAATEA